MKERRKQWHLEFIGERDTKNSDERKMRSFWDLVAKESTNMNMKKQEQ